MQSSRWLLAAVASIAATTAMAEDVVWSGAVGVSVSGNSLTKTGSAGWNAGAISTVRLDWGPAYVEFVATETNTQRLCGLSKGNTNSTNTDVDFAIHLSATGTFQVHESGTAKNTAASYSSGDRFRVEAEPGAVRYLRNGVVFYTSALIPKFPLLVDTSLNTVGATLTNVVMGTSVFSHGANVTVVGATLTKTGSAGWNAGAISAGLLEVGDGYVEWKATEINTSRAAGLSVGDGSYEDTDIDFAVRLESDGTYSIHEAGVSQGNFGGYTTNDIFRVEVQGGTVRYKRNGVVVHTSTGVPGYPLLVDTAFDTVGATLTDVKLVGVLWSNLTHVTASGGTLTKTGSSGWNAGAASTTSLDADGFVEFSAAETNTDRVAGLSNGDSNQSDSDVDYGIWLKADATAAVLEGGVNRGAFGSYASGDRFRVEVSDGAVKYRKNGVVFYSSGVSPSFPLLADTSLNQVGATLVNVAFGSLVWKSDTGVTVDGVSLQKTAAAGWNAGAASTRAITGDSWMETVATTVTGIRAIGLSNGDSSTNYTDIDFSLHFSGSTLNVYEAGTSRGSLGSYAAGDRFMVAVENNVVRYFKNGALVYTSGVTPTFPLRVDTALHSTDSVLADVAFNAGVPNPTVQTPTLTPSTGTYTSAQTVTVSCSTLGATIHYTTNGLNPTESDPVIVSGNTLTVDVSQTVRARAWKSGWAPSAIASATYTLRVMTPALSPSGGTYNTATNVTVSTTTPGASLYYTMNGVDPTPSDTPIASGATVLVDQSLTLKVRGFKTGWTASLTGWAAYTMKVATPLVTPASGTYAGSVTAALTTVTPSVSLHYTLDGSNPTAAAPSVTSGSTVAVSTSSTLRVRGIRAGWTSSDIGQASYLIQAGTATAPTFSPPAGTYTSVQSVTISSTTPGATIRYTTDGSDPFLLSKVYSGPIAVDAGVTLKARAFKADWIPSSTATADYVLSLATVCTPTLQPPPGTYTTQRVVIVGCDTTDTEIHYTLNGETPTSTDPTITAGSPLPTIAEDTVVKVKAWKTGLPEGAVRQGTYLITGAVAAGDQHSLALKSDGSVWGMGLNTSGQVGVGDTTNRQSPTRVLDPLDGSGYLTDVVAISAAHKVNVALKSAGSVFAWGNGRTTSVAVPGLTTVVAIAAGHPNFALKKDGTVWSWTTTSGSAGSPAQVAGLAGIAALAARGSTNVADEHRMALQTDGATSGSVWMWGSNSGGQLGDGTLTNSASPIRVLEGSVGIIPGTHHSSSLQADGTLRAWGGNDAGQVGNGTTTDALRPVSVTGHPALVQWASGHDHNLLVDARGRVWTWGSGANGRLATAFTENALAPVPSSLGRASSVAGGWRHSLAIRRDGTVWAWGDNTQGQAGTGTSGNEYVLPVQVPSFSVASNVADLDGDLVDNVEEVALGSDPTDTDSNDDGVSDAEALQTGKSVTDQDMDDDGVPNAVERTNGTDPFRADTDNDTVNDGTDCFPLDPTRNQCPTPTPGDTTPPTITLTEPTNAVLLP